MRSFFGIDGTPGPRNVADALRVKRLIWEGLVRAIDAGTVGRDEAGILVDATYGADIIGSAKAAGIRVAVPVEASGRRELDFEVPDWRERIDRLDPGWAKVLIRYNPDGDAEMNARQLARLKQLREHCTATSRSLMIELLVPPEPANTSPAYDTQIRPALMIRSIESFRGAGVDADVWKIEGLERREDCEQIARSAAAPCVVLGRGADAAAVDRWLRAAGGVPGFAGFAIGRSIWWDALKANDGVEDDAVARIAAAYGRYAGVWREAAAGS